jgi:hypothetical protein
MMRRSAQVPRYTVSVGLSAPDYEALTTYTSSLGTPTAAFVRRLILSSIPSLQSTQGAPGHEHECSGAPASVAS